MSWWVRNPHDAFSSRYLVGELGIITRQFDAIFRFDLHPITVLVFKSSGLKPIQNVVRDLDIEPLRIEIVSYPLLHRLVLGISWISEDLDQLVVAANSAAVFRRAGIRAAETDGVLECRIRR